MHSIHTSPLTMNEIIGAITVGIIFISIFSLVREPYRRTINAIIIAGAGGVYWTAGLGVWEFVFGSIMLVIAYKSLESYTFIGIGWLLHTLWDIAHHLYGYPIVFLDPASSAGCAICDPIIAAWCFFGAPSIFQLRKHAI